MIQQCLVGTIAEQNDRKSPEGAKDRLIPTNALNVRIDNTTALRVSCSRDTQSSCTDHYLGFNGSYAPKSGD